MWYSKAWLGYVAGFRSMPAGWTSDLIGLTPSSTRWAKSSTRLPAAFPPTVPIPRRTAVSIASRKPSPVFASLPLSKGRTGGVKAAHNSPRPPLILRGGGWMEIEPAPLPPHWNLCPIFPVPPQLIPFPNQNAQLTGRIFIFLTGQIDYVPGRIVYDWGRIV